VSRVGDPANAPVLLLHGTTGSGKSMLSEGDSSARPNSAPAKPCNRHRHTAGRPRAISLSPEAQHRAVELTRRSSCEIEFWPALDPSLAEGSREIRLDAYRALCDDLLARLVRRFPPRGAPVVG
jgi:hypothetical protein